MRELSTRRVPFVHAVVVRAQVPTSVRPGDDAIVLPDGVIEGFVGGQCAENSVRTAALGALHDRQSVLLRVLPEGETAFPDTPGARVVVNPCLSGGALEIFLEPLLPSPVLWIAGQSPIADAVTNMAELLEFAPRRTGEPTGATAVVIASHGHDETDSIRAGLEAGIGYIGLVASKRRAEALFAEMELTENERARIHAPVGLDIGARTAPEIAVSIMAEIIAAIRLEHLGVPGVAPAEPGIAEDPVCGMTVTVGPDTPHAVVDGADVWFCADTCRTRYLTGNRAVTPCS
ncbi:XdhC family protein [Sciscionella marina]|uniref:XdhC family protein n=1 Tax=Sciscionella marina TaxID=508770 RepID=UPI000A30CF66|nr:XdhC family protein [Sciscionella marina]